MNLQFLADGLITGSLIGLGAIGVTLTYSILRFSNFAHGDLMAWGTYAALGLLGVISGLFGAVVPLGALSFGWPLILAATLAMPLIGLLAITLDWLLFARLRARGQAIIVVMASFGASMALRSFLEFSVTSKPAYFSRAIQMAMPVGLGIRVTPDQIVLLLVTLALVTAVHLFMSRSQTGREMRAYSQNPALAQVVGIDVARIVRATWLIGGALACAAGVMVGILVQIPALDGPRHAAADVCRSNSGGYRVHSRRGSGRPDHRPFRKRRRATGRRRVAGRRCLCHSDGGSLDPPHRPIRSD